MGLSFLSTKYALGASYDTLPKNVNTLVFKQILASKIQSKFNSENREETLSLKEEFTSSRLEDISSVIKSYFEQLKEISPEAYTNFSLGEFSANVNAELSAQGIGYGFGVTDRLTVYGSLPVYHIKSTINFNQTKASNIAAIQNNLRNINPDSAIGKFVKDLTLQLPPTNAELLQSLVVNLYGYKPIGTWEKDGLGDAELGFVYRLTDLSDRGVAISGGVVLPTGQADDPDSLQDISTGDGQYDAFIESAAGMSFLDNSFQFDIKGRYTYQFASTKEVRWTDNPDLPLSDSKRSVSQKLGNKIDANVTLTYNANSWMNLNSSLLFNKRSETSYRNVDNLKVKEALESDTANESRWLRVGIGFSTIEAFKRKKFEIPLDVGISAQRLLNAKNTAKYNRFDIDFKMFF